MASASACQFAAPRFVKLSMPRPPSMRVVQPSPDCIEPQPANTSAAVAANTALFLFREFIGRLLRLPIGARRLPAVKAGCPRPLRHCRRQNGLAPETMPTIVHHI